MGLRGDRPAANAYGPEYSSADVGADLARRERNLRGKPLGCGWRLLLGCVSAVLGAAVLALGLLWWGLAHWPHPQSASRYGAHRPAPIGAAMERTRSALAVANADHRLTADEIDRAVDPEVPLLITRGASGATVLVADGLGAASSCVAFTAYGDGRVTGRVSSCPPRHPVTIRSRTATAPAT